MVIKTYYCTVCKHIRVNKEEIISHRSLVVSQIWEHIFLLTFRYKESVIECISSACRNKEITSRTYLPNVAREVSLICEQIRVHILGMLDDKQLSFTGKQVHQHTSRLMLVGISYIASVSQRSAIINNLRDKALTNRDVS